MPVAHVDPPWMRIARRELGVHEVSGPNANPRILEYHAATRASVPLDGDETPWCASFVSWVLEQTGIESTRSKAARSYAVWGKRVPLMPGAIVVLRRGSNPTQGHVGFLERVEGEHLWVLGGNQGNAVSIRPYAAIRLLACRWPKYVPTGTLAA